MNLVHALTGIVTQFSNCLLKSHTEEDNKEAGRKEEEEVMVYNYTSMAFAEGWIEIGKFFQRKRQYCKASRAFKKALKYDRSQLEALEGYNSSIKELRGVYIRAMVDPEVKAIWQDPVMQKILLQMETNPRIKRNFLKNRTISAKLQKLVDSGLLISHFESI